MMMLPLPAALSGSSTATPPTQLANMTNGTGFGADGDCAECLDDEDNPIKYPTVQALFCILYTTIFVLGVFGNVLVCYVVGRNRAMQTVTNFFITNLALSDILLCILAVPFTPLYSFVGHWVFGQLMCHLVTYAQGTSVYISTLTLTSIAIDRYFVIIYPFQPRMKQSTCMWIIMGIWTFSLLVTLPYGLYMSFRNTLCEEDWPSESFRQIYSGMTTVLQFLVPLKIIAFCYIRVSVRLSDHARLKPGCKSSRKEEADRERKRRTNRMLIAMVTVFGLSWMPLNVINLVNDIHMTIGNWRFYDLAFFCVHALAMSSTCYNPFLYAWLNDNFRKEFKQVLPCFIRFGLSGCSTGPASTQTTAPWRSEAGCNTCNTYNTCNTCNGGGAPPRTRPVRTAKGSEAHDALLPTTAPSSSRRRRSDDVVALTATSASTTTSTTIPSGAAAASHTEPDGPSRPPEPVDTELAAQQLRSKRRDTTASSPTTEVTCSGVQLGGDWVTYSTADDTVEVHLPLDTQPARVVRLPDFEPHPQPQPPPDRPLVSISSDSSPPTRSGMGAASTRPSRLLLHSGQTVGGTTVA